MIVITVSKIRPRWLRNTVIAVALPFTTIAQVVLGMVALILAFAAVIIAFPPALFTAVRDQIGSAITTWKTT